MSFITYVKNLGFQGVVTAKTKNPRNEIRGFRFQGFDPEVTRKAMGRAKKHTENLFVFVLSREHAIRVDTKRNIVLLANSRRAVVAFLGSIP